MCHPQGEERKFRIAAKSNNRKSVTKAGFTLDADYVSAQLVSALMKEEDQEIQKNAVTEMVVHGAADKWKKHKKVRKIKADHVQYIECIIEKSASEE